MAHAGFFLQDSLELGHTPGGNPLGNIDVSVGLEAGIAWMNELAGFMFSLALVHCSFSPRSTLSPT